MYKVTMGSVHLQHQLFICAVPKTGLNEYQTESKRGMRDVT
jgi:hypothetical protein